MNYDKVARECHVWLMICWLMIPAHMFGMATSNTQAYKEMGTANKHATIEKTAAHVPVAEDANEKKMNVAAEKSVNTVDSAVSVTKPTDTGRSQEVDIVEKAESIDIVLGKKSAYERIKAKIRRGITKSAPVLAGVAVAGGFLGAAKYIADGLWVKDKNKNAQDGSKNSNTPEECIKRDIKQKMQQDSSAKWEKRRKTRLAINGNLKTLHDYKQETDLFTALRHNDVEKVKILLNKNNDISCFTEEEKTGLTVLQYATLLAIEAAHKENGNESFTFALGDDCQGGDYAPMIKVLVERINRLRNYSTYYYSTRDGKSRRFINLLGLVARQGAMMKKILQTLIVSGDFDCDKDQDVSGFSVLASAGTNREVSLILLDADEVRQALKDEHKPWKYSLSHTFSEDPYLQQLAVEQVKKKKVDHAKYEQAQKSIELLEAACGGCDVALVSKLIVEDKANVNVKCPECGLTLLQHVAANNRANKDTKQCGNDCSYNKSTTDEQRALMIRRLLEHKADVHLRDNKVRMGEAPGISPLGLAATAGVNAQHIAQTLIIAGGANINRIECWPSSMRFSTLQYAERDEDMKKILLDAQAVSDAVESYDILAQDAASDAGHTFSENVYLQELALCRVQQRRNLAASEN